MIESITMRGLLSYGWEPVTLPLGPLNLFIGTNGSGKTNLIDAIDLLRSAPDEVARPLRNKGGAASWLHQGGGGDGIGWLEVVLATAPERLRYRLELQFQPGEATPSIGERLETAREPPDVPSLFLVNGGDGQASAKFLYEARLEREEWGTTVVDPRRSAISVLRGNPGCPQLNQVADLLGNIYLFQGWAMGPRSPARIASQDVGLPGRSPLDDGSNLAVVLDRLRRNGQAWARIRDLLKSLYPQIDDVGTSREDGQIKFFLIEEGLGAPVPPAHISDGTLHWLALLCLLADPEPPQLVCLEEPELGLHPDLISQLAGLLREASSRTQLIVTTHSDALVSEFTDSPEDVVVCERQFGYTTLSRLERAKLAHWLDQYSLGHVWLSGELGGTRW